MSVFYRGERIDPTNLRILKMFSFASLPESCHVVPTIRHQKGPFSAPQN